MQTVEYEYLGCSHAAGPARRRSNVCRRGKRFKMSVLRSCLLIAQVEQGLEHGLPGASSIVDRTIPTFSRGELPHFAGINTFMKVCVTHHQQPQHELKCWASVIDTSWCLLYDGWRHIHDTVFADRRFFFFLSAVCLPTIHCCFRLCLCSWLKPPTYLCVHVIPQQ